MATRILFLTAISFCLIALNISNLSAQSATDALRYSETTFGGTARSMAVAGAFGAIGADFSTAANNPSGIGLYRRNELSFTPSIFTNANEVQYVNSTQNQSGTRFNFTSMGYVFSRQPQNNLDWQNVNIAIGFNRLANYNSNRTMYGPEAPTSMTQFFAQQGKGSYYGDLGIAAGLVTATNNQPLAPQGGLYQLERMENSGGHDELNLAVGANYRNNLLIGASLNIPLINYKNQLLFTEDDKYNKFGNFSHFNLLDEIHASGTGINAKFGATFIPTNYLRIGVAAHTPTYISFEDVYSTSLTTHLDNSNDTYGDDDYGIYTYALVTPWRVTGSLGSILGKNGFVNADIEFVNYGSTRYNFNSSDANEIEYENFINSQIETAYGSAVNIKVGGELALNMLRLRAGYALYGSPFKNLNKQGRQNITGGIGLRGKNIYADLALVHSFYERYYQPYNLENITVPTAVINTTNNNAVLTVGFTF
ncbi:MAG: hypothetical protein IT272_12100 [Chitinophagales bacterium]|jgi:hypothetical protein|nr:hypothetical protein [Sphingobacteriales bacterium]MBP9140560.1 hypothetical protein [Chitinophagales bacterium]MDA0197260.1 hypothetical protein [Bacteroidota bacterium]MBK6890370.1 hypothetical protein [Sphingobacteriales bacterium]MBK8678561.1 hypothetical protein [Sphingobacteriales bacterium]